MNRGTRAVAWLMLMMLAAPAIARQDQLKDLPYQKLVAPTDAPLTVDQVEAAIRDSARKLGWTVVAREPGQMQLHLSIRVHEVDVAVKYDAAGFDVDYVSSVNMNFETGRKGQQIHPNYNAWVFNLADTIAMSPALEPGFVAEAADDEAQPPKPPVVTELALSGPVHVQRTLGYRRGYFVEDEIRQQCSWNQTLSGMARVYGKGLVDVTNEDVTRLPGYGVRTTVLHLRAVPFVAGPRWAVIRLELFDNGKLIGVRDVRRVTNKAFSGSCESMVHVADAIAGNTVEWLREGRFERAPDAEPIPVSDDARLSPAPAPATAATGAAH